MDPTAQRMRGPGLVSSILEDGIDFQIAFRRENKQATQGDLLKNYLRGNEIIQADPLESSAPPPQSRAFQRGDSGGLGGFGGQTGISFRSNPLRIFIRSDSLTVFLHSSTQSSTFNSIVFG